MPDERSPLPRVLEPEVMDSLAEAVDYDAMDHRAVNERFVADFLSALGEHSLDQAVDVIDLGTGTAQIPILLGQADAQLRIVAVDRAAHMLRLGGENVRAAGLDNRIELVLCDAKRLPYADGRFAAAVSNSIVHHIPEPRSVLGEAVRVVAPGGLIFVRDLMRPPDAPTLQLLVETYAGDANPHQRQMFDDSLHAALDLAEIRQIVEELGYDPASVTATSDRHWTWNDRRK